MDVNVPFSNILPSRFMRPASVKQMAKPEGFKNNIDCRW